MLMQSVETDGEKNERDQPSWLQDLKNGVQEMPADDLNQPKTSDDANQSGKDTTE
jgi:hypothetical protein